MMNERFGPFEAGKDRYTTTKDALDIAYAMASALYIADRA